MPRKKKKANPDDDWVPRSLSPRKKASNSKKRVKTSTPGKRKTKKVKRNVEDKACSTMKKVQVAASKSEAKQPEEQPEQMDIDVPETKAPSSAAAAAVEMETQAPSSAAAPAVESTEAPKKVERQLVDLNDEFLLRAPLKFLMKYHRQIKSDADHHLEKRVLEGRLNAKQETAVVKGLPRHCVPVRTDIRKFDWEKLGNTMTEKTGRKFDLIMMDPPWQLATADPTRGVCIAYDCLPDDSILNIPVQKVQDSGFLLIWTINSKMLLTRRMYEKWGYEILDSITWVKQSVNNRIASGHGYYLQHAFEICLVGVKKGKDADGAKERLSAIQHQEGIASDIIFAARRGQSQKPREIYEYCEALVPGGNFLEVFGRQHNCRDFWVTIGNEC